VTNVRLSRGRFQELLNPREQASADLTCRMALSRVLKEINNSLASESVVKAVEGVNVLSCDPG
jgi:hypothetical protein